MPYYKVWDADDETEDEVAPLAALDVSDAAEMRANRVWTASDPFVMILFRVREVGTDDVFTVHVTTQMVPVFEAGVARRAEV